MSWTRDIRRDLDRGGWSAVVWQPRTDMGREHHPDGREQRVCEHRHDTMREALACARLMAGRLEWADQQQGGGSGG